jgi:hypothetical protein
MRLVCAHALQGWPARTPCALSGPLAPDFRQALSSEDARNLLDVGAATGCVISPFAPRVLPKTGTIVYFDCTEAWLYKILTQVEL